MGDRNHANYGYFFDIYIFELQVGTVMLTKANRELANFKKLALHNF